MQWIYALGAAALTGWITAPAYAVEPVGFERWTTPPDHGLVFDAEFADLFAEYSNSASTLGGTLVQPGVSPQKARRVIDIEVHKRSSGHNVVDAVWVENSGQFQSDSWLLNGLSEDEVLAWTNQRGYVMLDIERYTRGSRTYFAAVLQRNPGLHEWSVLLHTSMDAIHLIASIQDMRVVDIDFVGTDPASGCPAEKACLEHAYDAVLVKNEGSNYMTWYLEEGWGTDPHVVGKAQLIDREKDDALSSDFVWWSAYLSVQVDNDYTTNEFLSGMDVWALDEVHRTIDLERDPEAAWNDPAPYYTVSADP